MIPRFTHIGPDDVGGEIVSNGYVSFNVAREPGLLAHRLNMALDAYESIIRDIELGEIASHLATHLIEDHALSLSRSERLQVFEKALLITANQERE